jgi:predicted CoA-binding protein|eukprot:gnl/Ergobibamus_cyprinoides/1100.p1 GENE.gnl/Ergobibamus_cyprinoides/1100~~gnl/Ergobibamus_cyprinoides/1100.p1  ORF type:complete len:148 (+),score=55.37 gnl/Ergobibamus_cyprinoides/1100:24-446(+)
MDPTLRPLITSAKTIAVVGISTDPEKISRKVAAYLHTNGFDVLSVNPVAKEDILGRKPFPTLAAIDVPVDIVNVFRRSDAIPGVVAAVLKMTPLPKVLWLQEGISSPSVEAAREAGITIVQDQCIMKVHSGVDACPMHKH